MRPWCAYEEDRGGDDLLSCCCDLGARFNCQSEPICGTMMRARLVKHDNDSCDNVFFFAVAADASILATLWYVAMQGKRFSREASSACRCQIRPRLCRLGELQPCGLWGTLCFLADTIAGIREMHTKLQVALLFRYDYFFRVRLKYITFIVIFIFDFYLKIPTVNLQSS